MGFSRVWGIVALLILQTSPNAHSATVAASHLYVPPVFLESDPITAVLEGYLNSTCEHLRGAKIVTHGTRLEILPRVVTRTGDCDLLKVPYTLEVVLNADTPIPVGDYEVEAASEFPGKPHREPLKVIDDVGQPIHNHLYAPIDFAEVAFLSGGNLQLRIEGRLQNTCTVVDKIEIAAKSKTIYEALPILARLKRDPRGRPCVQKEWRFIEYENFAEPTPGRYLMHVRSQNGHALNRIFSNVW